MESCLCQTLYCYRAQICKHVRVNAVYTRCFAIFNMFYGRFHLCKAYWECPHGSFLRQGFVESFIFFPYCPFEGVIYSVLAPLFYLFHHFLCLDGWGRFVCHSVSGSSLFIRFQAWRLEWVRSMFATVSVHLLRLSPSSDSSSWSAVSCDMEVSYFSSSRSLSVVQHGIYHSLDPRGMDFLALFRINLLNCRMFSDFAGIRLHVRSIWVAKASQLAFRKFHLVRSKPFGSQRFRRLWSVGLGDGDFWGSLSVLPSLWALGCYSALSSPSSGQDYNPPLTRRF